MDTYDSFTLAVVVGVIVVIATLGLLLVLDKGAPEPSGPKPPGKKN